MLKWRGKSFIRGAKLVRKALSAFPLLLCIFCASRDRVEYHDQFLWEHAKKGDLDSIERSLADGVDPNRALEFDERGLGGTMLTRAALSGHTNVVEALLRAGASISAEDSDGFTPLSAAAAGGNSETVKALLVFGVDPELETERGETALFAAGSRDVVRVLVESGANVNKRNRSGGTPLFMPAALGEYEIVDELLHAGANPNVAVEDGETALRYAAGNCHARVVRLLIDHEANVNSKNARGETALMAPLDDQFRLLAEEHIPREETLEVMRILIDAGAHVDATRDDGLSALDLAESGRNYPVEPVVKLLREAAAR